MINKKYPLLFLVIASVAGLFFMSGSTPSLQEDINEESSIAKGGWIENLTGETYLVKSGEIELSPKKKLDDGDGVNPGDVLETGDNAKVIIHLFDGSVIRVESNTTLAINKAEYNRDSGRLILEAGLSAGKVWSKIIELATPDSVWKVETSNTVATVRGSAFGISTDGKVSEVFGSQHKVAVDIVNSKTGKIIKGVPIIVDEQMSLKISDDDIEKLKKAESTIGSTTEAVKMAEVAFVPIKMSDKRRGEEWFKGNEDRDVEIESEVKVIKEEVKQDKVEFKKVLNKKVEDRLLKLKEKTRSKRDETVLNEKNKEESSDVVKKIETKEVVVEEKTEVIKLEKTEPKTEPVTTKKHK